jgi:alkylphosphonate utilization operon protein PhnA
MPFSSSSSLKRFFSILSDLDASEDLKSAQSHGEELEESERIKLTSELRSVLDLTEIPLGDLGAESNRWFGSDEEARNWLSELLAVLDQAGGGSDSMTVVDSNGAPLSEGDSVTVIKDLKVKGGSSDLKRGTLIKSIHLTSDPGLIECKVDGSVLVLKTIFLKKS